MNAFRLIHTLERLESVTKFATEAVPLWPFPREAARGGRALEPMPLGLTSHLDMGGWVQRKPETPYSASQRPGRRGGPVLRDGNT